jgi:hypothetical protein
MRGSALSGKMDNAGYRDSFTTLLPLRSIKTQAFVISLPPLLGEREEYFGYCAEAMSIG